MDPNTSINEGNTILNSEGSTIHHVVIVGAGVSGLICARELLRTNPTVRITVVEASDHLGGRILGHRCHGVEIDIGAEFIHGSGSLLTELINELFVADTNLPTPTVDRKHFSSEILEPVFTVSHADGGPDSEPTVSGKYGMYYIDGSMRPFNDPVALELRTALDDLFYPPKSDVETEENVGDHDDSIYDNKVSIGDSLDRTAMSRSARQLALSSYGNTAACADLYSLSLPIMKHFENYWFNHETPGDFRFSSHSGITMKSVLDKLVLQFKEYRPRCSFLCNWKVRSVRQRDDETNPGNTKDGNAVTLVSDDDKILLADAAVVTVPPPMLQELDIELSAKKKYALSLVGFPRVMKVILIFSSAESPWPEMLNGIICADELPIPEIWFTEKIVADLDSSDRQGSETNEKSDVLYIAVGYLTSQIADDFVMKMKMETLSSENEGTINQQNATFSLTSSVSPQAIAARIFIHQLAQVLNISEELLRSSCLDCILHDWKLEPNVRGGYMYGKKGMTQLHLHDLAEPQQNVFFAGEATNTNACCTVQAAMETGVRAANEVSRHLGLGL